MVYLVAALLLFGLFYVVFSGVSAARDGRFCEWAGDVVGFLLLSWLSGD